MSLTTDFRVLSEKRTEARLIVLRDGACLGVAAGAACEGAEEEGLSAAGSGLRVSRLADSLKASAGLAMDLPLRSIASFSLRPITLMIFLLSPSGLNGLPRYSETPPLTASIT